MLVNERRQQILSILQRERFATVEKLCSVLFSSPATVRRDLAQMAARGELKRLRGGAELASGGTVDMPSALRLQKDKAQKEIIAALAARYLEAAGTVFMDSSSTVYYLARQLSSYAGRSVITNGSDTLAYLGTQTDADVYSTGGRLLGRSGYVGRQAVDAVSACCTDVMFFSCCGFSAQNGSTEAEESVAELKRAMAGRARRRILLCDSGKFGRDYFFRALPVESIDMIITDRRPDERICRALQSRLVYPGAEEAG